MHILISHGYAPKCQQYKYNNSIDKSKYKKNKRDLRL